MTTPNGIRAESNRSPKASRAGALYVTQLYSTLRQSSLLTFANADTREGEPASVEQALRAGLRASGERHDVIRSGEREPIPHHVRSAVWYRDDGRCEHCPTSDFASPWELDHILPWSAGGSDKTTNLRVLCQQHNQQRSNYRDALERPRRAATWWCLNCYDDSERLIWQYAGTSEPGCPIHRRGGCRVMSGYRRGRELFDDFTPWHEREPMSANEATTIAYCAHCDAPALTAYPL